MEVEKDSPQVQASKGGQGIPGRRKNLYKTFVQPGLRPALPWME